MAGESCKDVLSLVGADGEHTVGSELNVKGVVAESLKVCGRKEDVSIDEVGVLMEWLMLFGGFGSK